MERKREGERVNERTNEKMSDERVRTKVKLFCSGEPREKDGKKKKRKWNIR